MSDENKEEYKTERERIQAEINKSDGKPQNKDERFVNAAFLIAIAGVITIGAFPFLGLFGVVSSIVMSLRSKSGRAELSEFFKWKNRQTVIAALISFVLTFFDVILIFAFKSRFM